MVRDDLRKFRSKLLKVAVAPFFLTACASTGSVTSLLQSSYSPAAILSSPFTYLIPAYLSPLDADSGPLLALKLPPDAGRLRTGESCAHNILALVAWGDASIRGAAETRHIEKIESVSFSTSSILLIIYNEYCTRVTGA